MNGAVVTWQDCGVYWHVCVNNPPVNATSTAVRRGLYDALSACVGEDKKAVLLSCSGTTFIAGGDITEFDAPPQEPHLPDICQMIEDAPLPWVVALHGHVLGGGLEIAMSAAFRIAQPKTNFGMSEVKVGLIPGAGGSQRLPRLVGMPMAVQMLTTGAVIAGSAFYEAGGIDMLIADDDDIMAAARAFIADLPPRPQPLSKRDIPAFAESLFDEARASLEKKTAGQIAPLANLDMLALACSQPFDKAQPTERQTHLALRDSAQSRALRYVFMAERKVARPASTKHGKAQDLQKIGVVGGGLMGTGIAFSCLLAGYNLCLIERDDVQVANAQAKIDTLIDGAVSRGKIQPSDKEAIKGRLLITTDFAALADASLIIEAVFEDLSVKKQVFAALGKVVSDDAILATNTSYLNPENIMAGLANPARLIGLHFFSPAHIMKLVEIITLSQTSDDVITTAFAFAKSLRKIGVQSGICDGFIGNRILAAYRRQADYMLLDGASPRQIDNAMKAFGLPMGPYQQQDLSGLQIAWANRKRQADTRPAEQRYVTIGDRLCEAEHFGKRGGKGWYHYEDGSRVPHDDADVAAIIDKARAEAGIKVQSFTDEEIAMRLVAVMANEGALIHEEGIAERFLDIDMVKLHGYGFPRWRGGPMHYAQEIGWDKISAVMQDVATQSPNSWVLAQHCKQHV